MKAEIIGLSRHPSYAPHVSIRTELGPHTHSYIRVAIAATSSSLHDRLTHYAAQQDLQEERIKARHTAQFSHSIPITRVRRRKRRSVTFICTKKSQLARSSQAQQALPALEAYFSLSSLFDVYVGYGYRSYRCTRDTQIQIQ
jgi:hypothetical protein